MSTPSFSSQSFEHHELFEVDKNATLTAVDMENWKKDLLHVRQMDKKCILTLPGNCKLHDKKQVPFMNFLKRELPGQYMFVPQDALQWGDVWRTVVKEDMVICDKYRAEQWTKGESFPAQVSCLEMGDIFYLKLSGDTHSAIKKVEAAFSKAFQTLKVKGDVLGKPKMVKAAHFTSWVGVGSSIVIDLVDTFRLSNKLLNTIVQQLKKHNTSPSDPGIYFVTSGVFQTWTLRQVMGEVHVAGNIIRVLPESGYAGDDVIRSEVTSLLNSSSNETPPLTLFYHQVQGSVNAQKVIDYFSPDIVIVNEISVADQLRNSVSQYRKEKIYHITPAARAGLMLLGPQMITDGYDLDLFASYLVSRYQNNRGKPNDTFIYYLETHPDRLKKVVAFIMAEFAHVFTEEHSKTLTSLTECETRSDQQGNFLVSLLEEQILRFQIHLFLTDGGYGSFLSSYEQVFPDHYQELCAPLRFFLRADQTEKTIDAKMHIVEGYNEIKVEQKEMLLELRTQKDQAMMIFKAEPNDHLERRCKGLFTLLNGCDAFRLLPDKEILIELVSLLWSNFQASMKKSQGFVITLMCKEQTTTLEVFQDKHNKAIIKEEMRDGSPHIEFIGDTIFHQNSQKALLKMISLFYVREQPDPKDNTWRFACFEALTQVAASGDLDQSISYNMQIHGDRWSGVFECSSRLPHNVPDRSQKTLEMGSDKFDISGEGRKIFLVKNPFEDEVKEKEYIDQMIMTQDDLKNLKESVILQKVADAKAEETAKSSAILQASYAKALKKYNKNSGGAEEETADASGLRVRSLEDAVRVRVHKPSNLEEKQRKTIGYTLGVVATILFFVSIFVLYIFNAESDKSKGGMTIQQSAGNDDFPIDANTASVAPTVEKETPKEKLPADPARSIIVRICRQLYQNTAPTQEELNAFLKELYLNREEFSQSGDLYNLMGRLFWYKIHLDQEKQIFSPEWIFRWKGYMKEYFQTAQQKYDDKKVKTNMALSIKQWMPDKDFYFYTTREQKKKYVRYDNVKEAGEDMKTLLSGLDY